MIADTKIMQLVIILKKIGNLYIYGEKKRSDRLFCFFFHLFYSGECIPSYKNKNKNNTYIYIYSERA